MTVRELAKRVAEIAAMPVHEERLALWRALNGLRPKRPMVMIDQVCWGEMNVGGELSCVCEDKDLRAWEWRLRSAIYQWERFPVDMVVESFFRVHKAVRNTGFGIGAKVVGRKATAVYENQIRSMEDVGKVAMPSVTHDEAETARLMGLAEEAFGGVMEVRLDGCPYVGMSVWDPISNVMGVEGALYALTDEPAMMRALVGRYVSGLTAALDQLEAQGLLCGPQPLIHCSGAWTDELPGEGYDPGRPTTKGLWMMGLAQMLSTVSPAAFLEYEVEPLMPLFERFGLVYYGCCEPLDLKMEEVRRIPNLRKVSMSPWARKERGAEGIRGDYVYSCKPNPAFLAMDGFDEDHIRADLTETRRICERHGCPVEFILKDITTVRNRPERLWRWAEIAMEVAEG
ncbi:MAG: hypothetical protein FWE70_03085 [Oscillospiraceae bacterium]|nr:hypothetical protein [Oscillospiraceae bacterium]